MLISKAFEKELAARFVTRYKEYVNVVCGNDYAAWPGALLRKNKYGQYKPMETRDFTLGDCSFIFGIRQDSDRTRTVNNEIFYDYCKDQLMPDIPETAIRKKISLYGSKIDYIRTKFRNPASHKEPIPIYVAQQCVDYVLEAYYRTLLHRQEMLQKELGKKQVVHPTLISTFGLRQNEYSGFFAQVISLDDLMRIGL